MHAIPATRAPALAFERLCSFERAVFAVERAICIAALAVMLFAISMSVLVRYLSLPIPNFAEWGVVAMAPLTFIGAAMCSYTGTHIAVDFVNTLESALMRRAGRFCTGTAAIVFATVYVTSSWVFFRETLHSGEKMMDMGTPVAVPLFFLPLGLALVLFHSVLEIWRTLAAIEPTRDEEDAQ